MRKTANKIHLKEVFMNLQEQMVAKLSSNVQIIKHPVTKGDASELNWIDMLNTYLPKRYKVDKAFVLDSNGTLSEQIDIVVYDHQYSPFLFHQDDAIYVPSESVYAVFEVRQNINKRNIDYAGEKAESVRRLERTTAPIPHAGGLYPAKPPFRILAGVLALGSDWTPPFESAFETVLHNLDENKRLDLGCVLQWGGFDVTYEPRLFIEKSESQDALIFFFLRLLHRLQQLGTISAIDITKYGQALR